MKKSPTFTLKVVIVALGLGVLALCIFALPAMWSGIEKEYPDYPKVVYTLRLFLVGMYLSAILFYFGLYQGLKLLGLIDRNMAFSNESVKALRSIKFYTFFVGIIYLAGVPLLFPFADVDDAPGVLVIGFVIACAPIVLSIFASVLQKLIQNALDIKSENDLTV